MAQHFKKGDRVRFVEGDNDEQFLLGQEGVVIKVNNIVGVRFDFASPRLHDLQKKCDDHHGWWCFSKQLELASSAVDVSQFSLSFDDMWR